MEMAMGKEKPFKLNFTTYTDNGEKFIVIFHVEGDEVTWSKHYKVKTADEDRGIQNGGFDENRLFPELQHV
ncbi:MAG: hypothetical protein LUI12_01755 [Clostridiales bacterium]|nr:hypothetical protein [Clostridiales bacterium]